MEHSWRRAVSDAATGLVIHNVKRLPKRGESGFTLVEVLVAIVVLSITGLAAHSSRLLRFVLLMPSSSVQQPLLWVVMVSNVCAHR